MSMYFILFLEGRFKVFRLQEKVVGIFCSNFLIAKSEFRYFLEQSMASSENEAHEVD